MNEKPVLTECLQIGNTTSGIIRPVKLRLNSTEAVNHILRKSHKLRGSANYKSVYISSDLSAKERLERRTLENEMKKKMKLEPGKYHYIRVKKICSKDHAKKTNT